MKKYLITITIILSLFSSCSNKTKKYYYDSGELSRDELCINDSMTYIKDYYKNGIIETEGMIRGKDTTNEILIMNGNWKLYYSDGTLQWEGEIINNVIQDEYIWNWEKIVEKRLKGIEIEGNPTEFIVGKNYKFRVIMPETHPKFYLVFDDNYQNLKNNENDYELFPYVYKCTEESINLLIIVFMNSDGSFVNSRAYTYPFLLTPGRKNNFKRMEEIQVGDTLKMVKEITHDDGTIDTVIVFR
jgi:hypothetical protein